MTIVASTANSRSTNNTMQFHKYVLPVGSQYPLACWQLLLAPIAQEQYVDALFPLHRVHQQHINISALTASSKNNSNSCHIQGDNDLV